MTTSEPMLHADTVTLGYDRHTVFTGLDLQIEPGTVTTLIGANGCGKSTLLKAFGRLLAPSAGHIKLGGTSVRHLSARAVARRLAILPQKPLTPAATSVTPCAVSPISGAARCQASARPAQPMGIANQPGKRCLSGAVSFMAKGYLSTAPWASSTDTRTGRPCAMLCVTVQ